MTPLLTYLTSTTQEALDLVRDMARQEGLDFYTKVASLAFKIKMSEVTPAQRAEAKAALFAQSYGQRLP